MGGSVIVFVQSDTVFRCGFDVEWDMFDVDGTQNIYTRKTKYITMGISFLCETGMPNRNK